MHTQHVLCSDNSHILIFKTCSWGTYSANINLQACSLSHLWSRHVYLHGLSLIKDCNALLGLARAGTCIDQRAKARDVTSPVMLSVHNARAQNVNTARPDKWTVCCLLAAAETLIL